MGRNECCCGKYNAREGSKIIGVVSACLAALATVGFIWELIRQLREESQVGKVVKSLDRLGEVLGNVLPDDEFQYQSISQTYETRRNVLGACIGITLVTLLVAIALVFAAKKNNRMLALPFMIWTIITQVACGIFIALFIFYVAVSDWSDPKQHNDLIRLFVAPLVSGIINFIIYTWWLTVVFNFYHLLKSGQAFDSIPMQTA